MKIKQFISTYFNRAGLKTSFFAWVACLSTLLNASVHAAPQIQHWISEDRLAVYWVPTTDLPIVDVRLSFSAGSARDDQQPGLAQLTNSLLDQGAGKWSADQIAERFDAIGARYSSGVSLDYAWLQLRTLSLKTQQEQAFETWLQVLSQPTFSKKAMENQRKQSLQAINLAKQSPSKVANQAFMRALYQDHPYSKPTMGEAGALNDISTEDVRQFYKRFYVAKNAILVLVGDLEKSAAEALASRIAKSLPAGKAAQPLPEPKPMEKSEQIMVDYPSSQSHILIGQLGSKRGDPDYFPLYLTNYIFGGGGFISRLMQKVRVEKGLSYSVSSYFIPYGQLGPFILSLQTQNNNVDEALPLIQKMLESWKDKGVTQAELDLAKKKITGGFPLRTATNSDLLAYVSMIANYGLPLNYLERFTTNIKAVTVEQANDALRRRMHPDRLLTVIVGQEAQQEAPKKHQANN